ncbi:SRPBCC family protein [Actinokineospora xionganensis]|uniref:SRPBCC family protein n=1 Tax=Actinokineospora xionganensis TaxID=2684470 RepID=A0ABR7L3G8_9PSEU|nr:SRPBCC family protein [Actinokineospora xionganensis]MBC6447226.1 SRPBCC family protein [Actinokineospora xionganensis]
MTVTITTPSPTELAVTRSFDAPRALVFDALTKPELLKRWHGAQGWNLIECAVDLRVGGDWRFVSQGPGGIKMGHGGVYQEIDAPARLVYTESYDDQWFEGEALITATLTETAGRTTVRTVLRFGSTEIRDLVAASPMESGISQSYARLDDVLASVSKG